MPNYDDLRNLPESVPTVLGALKSTPPLKVSAVQEQMTKTKIKAFYHKKALVRFETQDFRHIAVDLYGEEPTLDVKEVKSPALDDGGDDDGVPVKTKPKPKHPETVSSSEEDKEDTFTFAPKKHASTSFTLSTASAGVRKGEMLVFSGGSVTQAKQIPCGTPAYPEVDEPTLYLTTKEVSGKDTVYLRVWLPDTGWCKGISIERLTKMYKGLGWSNDDWGAALMTPFRESTKYLLRVLTFEPLKGKIDERLYEYLYKNTLGRPKAKQAKPKWVSVSGCAYRVYPDRTYSQGLSIHGIRWLMDADGLAPDAVINGVFGEDAPRKDNAHFRFNPISSLPGDVEAYLNQMISRGT